jgi:hypothetical protein
MDKPSGKFANPSPPDRIDHQAELYQRLAADLVAFQREYGEEWEVRILHLMNQTVPGGSRAARALIHMVPLESLPVGIGYMH